MSQLVYADSIDTAVAPETDAGEISGLLGEAVERAGDIGGRFAAGLLRGWSRSMASVGCGVSLRQIQRYEERDPRLAECFERLEELGFARTFEHELYRRAMAGADDRSSARLLEIVIKARRPEYRDKSQIEMTHSVASRKAMTAISAGWQENSEDA